MFNHKKIIVIGCSGSGKTTFSRKLSNCIHFPVHHLDSLYWKADSTHISRADFIDRQSKIFQFDKWIIDGNYRNTLEMRIRECDLIYFFDIPVADCISGAVDRVKNHEVRIDLPCELPANEELLDFIRNFNTDVRPWILKLFEKYADKKVITFHTRDEADQYLAELEASLEYWDVYDVNRNLIPGKSIIRSLESLKDGEYHLVVDAVVFNSKGEMLIQHRQPFKEGWSDLWSITCGGSALRGETSRQAVHRELLEEVGIDYDFDQERPRMTLNFSAGFHDLYVVNQDVDITALNLQHEEVLEVKWAGYDEIVKLIEEEKFLPYFESFIKLLFDIRLQKQGCSLNETHPAFIKEFSGRGEK